MRKKSADLSVDNDADGDIVGFSDGEDENGTGRTFSRRGSRDGNDFMQMEDNSNV